MEKSSGIRMRKLLNPSRYARSVGYALSIDRHVDHHAEWTASSHDELTGSDENGCG